MRTSRIFALACSLVACATPSDAALTGAARLSAVYELILAAQFDRADAELTSTCPPAPQQACTTLEVVSLWWRIQVDPDNRSRDRLLNDRARAAVKAAGAWTTRAPKDAEAWFYLAGSYAPLVQWQVLRGEADFQRYLIDIWYERKPDEGLSILKSLDARYPTNPIFLQRIAETFDTYLHDRRASAAAWQALIDRARSGGLYDAARVLTLAERKRRAIS